MNESVTLIRRRAVMTRALLRAAAGLGLRRTQLASVTGLALDEIAALDADRLRLSPGDARWNQCVLLVRLCQAVDEFAAGDRVAMRTWMLDFNDALQGAPIELLDKPRGLSDLVVHVEACLRRAAHSSRAGFHKLSHARTAGFV